MILPSIAIIGCGAAAVRYYAPAIKFYRRLLSDVYLVDPNKEAAISLRDNIGFGEVYCDYYEIIDKVQGVIVVVPNHLHYKIAKEFLDSKVHVLCEKPLTIKPEEAEELIEAAKSANVFLCVNNSRRMYPSFRSIKNLLQEKSMGNVLQIEYTEGNSFAWESTTGFYTNPKTTDKGVLLDIGAHSIDTICWWLGKRPTVYNYTDDSFGGPESLSKINAEIDATKINIVLNRLCELDNKYKIVTECGVIEGKVTEPNRYKICNTTSGTLKEINFKEKYPHNNFAIPIFHNFVKAINGLETPLIPGESIIDSLYFINECYLKRKNENSIFYSNIDLLQKKYTSTDIKQKRKVLVTGASGFIGCRIVEMLYLSGLISVRAAIRKWSSGARIGRFPVDIVIMDVLNTSQIEQSLDGVTDIIHCAYGNYDTTVKGTENLLKYAHKLGVNRFIHLSTAEVYGNMSSGIVDESHPIQYTENEYNKMKAEAEHLCWEWFKRGLALTIIRPFIVYGPFSRNWTMKFAALLKDGSLKLYENYGEGVCNLIYIDDLVRAIIASIFHENAIGQAFNVSGPDSLTWNEYFNLFNQLLGLPQLEMLNTNQAKLKSISMQPIRFAGRFIKKHFLGPFKLIADRSSVIHNIMKKAEYATKSTLSIEELQMLNRTVQYSTNKIKDYTGFSPKIDSKTGLKITVDWLREQGFFSTNNH